MKIECAWCGKKMGRKPPYFNRRTTHVICKKCREKNLEESRSTGRGVNKEDKKD